MAKRQTAAATAASGRTRRAEQRDPTAAAQEMMQESMAEIQGLAKAAEAADTDADVDVSQTSTVTRKRKETETTPRAEASSVALARSLTEKESLLREQHDELEKLKRTVRRLSKDSASASPAAPQTPSSPNTPGKNKVQFILCFSRYNVYFVLFGS